MLEMQPGDVLVTYADISRLAGQFGYAPQTSIEEGISRFVDWFRAYFNLPG
jgi:UDP-glucuronate 4-epimerase